MVGPSGSAPLPCISFSMMCSERKLESRGSPDRRMRAHLYATTLGALSPDTRPTAHTTTYTEKEHIERQPRRNEGQTLPAEEPPTTPPYHPVQKRGRTPIVMGGAMQLPLPAWPSGKEPTDLSNCEQNNRTYWVSSTVIGYRAETTRPDPPDRPRSTTEPVDNVLGSGVCRRRHTRQGGIFMMGTGP